MPAVFSPHADEKQTVFDYPPSPIPENLMQDSTAPKTDLTDANVRLILTWLATHRDSPDMDLEALPEHLQSLRKSSLPARQTLKLLEMLYTCTAASLEARMTQLSKASIPLPRQIRQQFNTLQEILDGFALAYESVFAALPHDASPRETSLTLERTASCLSRHLHISHLVAAPPSLGIWQRLHATFLQTRQANPDQPLPPYGEALLLACAQPASFSAQELMFIAHYAQDQARSLKISEQPPEDIKGVFWIDPSRDFPAFALARRAPPPEFKVYYFSCRAVAQQAETHLQALIQGQSAQSLNLPPLASTPAGKGTLRRLIAFWGSPGKRRFPRRRQAHRATLCSGLNRLWRMLQTPEKMSSDDFSQWMITNESPDGYALMHLNGKAGRVRVGDIVALRTETDAGSSERWQICLVRWAISENPEHIEIGLQVLAPEAIPARLAVPSDPGNKAQTSALILPELPPLRPEPVLVVPAGSIVDPQHKLLLLIERSNLEIRQVRTAGICDQTERVEVFTIENDAS